MNDESLHFGGTAKPQLDEALYGSGWKITISSNQQKYHGNFDLFQDIIKRLTLSSMLLNFLFVSDYPPDTDFENWHFPKPEELKGVIDGVDIKATIEVGSVAKRIHSHIFLSCFHYKYFQLDPIKLRHWVNQVSGGKILPNIQINMRNVDVAGRRYLNKDFKKRKNYRVVSEFRDLEGDEFFYDSARP